MGNRLDGINPLSYQGIRASTPPQMIVENRAPTQNDLANRVLGTQWLWLVESDATQSRMYVLASVEQNVGVWIDLVSNPETILPEYSVVLGTGVPGLTSVGPDSFPGLPLTSQGDSANPAFQTLYPQGGGTGLNSIPEHNLIVGNDLAAVNVIAPMATVGAPLVSTGSSSDPEFGVASVSGGGTGLDTIAPYSVVCGGITSEGPLQVVSGVGTLAQVLTSNGLGMLPTWQNVGALSGGGVLVTVLNTPGSGNHTLNAATIALSVIGFGAGGGGGSGRQGASGAAGGGGGGGNGGTFVYTNMPSSAFGGGGGIVAYTVGAGGAGGAAQTISNTDGNDGSDGGITSFGSIVIGGAGLESMGGAGGTATEALGGVNSYCLNLNVPGMVMAGGGGSGSEVDGQDGIASQSSTMFPSSGAGGAGADSGSERTGGDGAYIASYQSAGLTIVLNGGAGGVESGTINGGDGNDGSTATDYFCGGSGAGGGGGQSVGAAAGNGGVGGSPGGGGGGGGGSLNSTNSGAGGDGGDGALIIIEYLSGGGGGGIDILEGDDLGTATGTTVKIAGGVGITTSASGSTVVINASGGGAPIQINILTFDTPGAGTYTPTAGMFQCIVECVGGGAGGSGIRSGPGANQGTGGGGAGGYCKSIYDAATIGASQSYEVGEGGIGGSNATIPPTEGTDTTFGTLMTAVGGGIPTTYSSGSNFVLGGPGGDAEGGDINIVGQSGGSAFVAVSSGIPGTAGAGGSTVYGFGGASVTANNSVGSVAGLDATGYGGGGGGASKSSQGISANLNGGNGANGVIIITEYIS